MSVPKIICILILLATLGNINPGFASQRVTERMAKLSNQSLIFSPAATAIPGWPQFSVPVAELSREGVKKLVREVTETFQGKTTGVVLKNGKKLYQVVRSRGKSTKSPEEREVEAAIYSLFPSLPQTPPSSPRARRTPPPPGQSMRANKKGKRQDVQNDVIGEGHCCSPGCCIGCCLDVISGGN